MDAKKIMAWGESGFPARFLAAMPAGRPWLFALLLWRSALPQAETLDLQWRDLNFAAAAPTITARKSNVSRGQINANQE